VHVVGFIIRVRQVGKVIIFVLRSIQNTQIHCLGSKLDQDPARKLSP